MHTLSLTNTFYEDPVTAKALQDARAKWSLAAAHRIFLPLWIINLLDDSLLALLVAKAWWKPVW